MRTSHATGSVRSSGFSFRTYTGSYITFCQVNAVLDRRPVLLGLADEDLKDVDRDRGALDVNGTDERRVDAVGERVRIRCRLSRW